VYTFDKKIEHFKLSKKNKNHAKGGGGCSIKYWESAV